VEAANAAAATITASATASLFTSSIAALTLIISAAFSATSGRADIAPHVIKIILSIL
jgi:hypothetical protein